MYLTGGEFKGYKIEIPKTARPTLSKVRESIFNILDNLDCGNYFLDMFSGSGIIALEALSRGYRVKGIEINKKSADIIKKNYEKMGQKPDIIICDALKYTGDKFDIIYIDPPWEKDYIPIIKKAYSLLNKNGIIIIEHDKALEYDLLIQELDIKIIKSKKYGRCLIDFLSAI
jgi:16S rRNA (guanine(966)-N(2))-methyltransferase RsmD